MKEVINTEPSPQRSKERQEIDSFFDKASANTDQELLDAINLKLNSYENSGQAMPSLANIQKSVMKYNSQQNFLSNFDPEKKIQEIVDELFAESESSENKAESKEVSIKEECARLEEKIKNIKSLKSITEIESLVGEMATFLDHADQSSDQEKRVISKRILAIEKAYKIIDMKVKIAKKNMDMEDMQQSA